MPRTKEILRLRYELGLTIRAIAHSVEVSTITVSEVCYRAGVAGVRWLLGHAIALGYMTTPADAYGALSGVLPLAVEPLQKAKIHHNLGVALRRLDRMPEALSHLEEALHCHTETSPAAITATLTQLCLCHALSGHGTDARTALRQALAVPGTKDAPDMTALIVFANHLGWDSDAAVRAPKVVRDDYEARAMAALELLKHPSEAAS